MVGRWHHFIGTCLPNYIALQHLLPPAPLKAQYYIFAAMTATNLWCTYRLNTKLGSVMVNSKATFLATIIFL